MPSSDPLGIYSVIHLEKIGSTKSECITVDTCACRSKQTRVTYAYFQTRGGDCVKYIYCVKQAFLQTWKLLLHEIYTFSWIPHILLKHIKIGFVGSTLKIDFFQILVSRTSHRLEIRCKTQEDENNFTINAIACLCITVLVSLSSGFHPTAVAFRNIY